jgi:hypothetical protein
MLFLPPYIHFSTELTSFPPYPASTTISSLPFSLLLSVLSSAAGAVQSPSLSTGTVPGRFVTPSSPRSLPFLTSSPRQKWPTTCLLGTLLGFGIGSVVSLAVTGYKGALVAAADVVREAKEQQQAAAKGEKKVVKGKKAQ